MFTSMLLNNGGPIGRQFPRNFSAVNRAIRAIFSASPAPAGPDRSVNSAASAGTLSEGATETAKPAPEPGRETQPGARRAKRTTVINLIMEFI